MKLFWLHHFSVFSDKALHLLEFTFLYVVCSLKNEGNSVAFVDVTDVDANFVFSQLLGRRLLYRPVEEGEGVDSCVKNSLSLRSFSPFLFLSSFLPSRFFFQMKMR